MWLFWGKLKGRTLWDLGFFLLLDQPPLFLYLKVHDANGSYFSIFDSETCWPTLEETPFWFPHSFCLVCFFVRLLCYSGLDFLLTCWAIFQGLNSFNGMSTWLGLACRWRLVSVFLLVAPWPLTVFQNNSSCLFFCVSDRAMVIYVDLPWLVQPVLGPLTMKSWSVCSLHMLRRIFIGILLWVCVRVNGFPMIHYMGKSGE